VAVADDIALIKQQEQALVLPALDEGVAFEIGASIRQRALAEGLALVCDVRTWDRQLFFAATAGTTADNSEWVRRKINLVRRFGRASYRMLLEQGGEGPLAPRYGVDGGDYVLAGGGFPLRVEGAGIVGCLTISGLPGRDDHGVAVAALANHLELDPARLMLPTEVR
jgi:uncharacterized protein (UPF0303 family)